jgi:phosphoribosyl-AMP cyclohydrolase
MSNKPDTEEGTALAPKFDADGLVTCVATDAGTGDVLMVAHMNAQALAKTIETGEAWYFSRSRRALWKKGESGRRSCFYRAVPLGKVGAATLQFRDADRTFDPGKVYDK